MGGNTIPMGGNSSPFGEWLDLISKHFGKVDIVGLINKTDIQEAKKGNLHQEGTFLAKVIGIETKPSKAGNPMVTLNLRSAGGRIRYWLTLSPTWSLIRKTKALGITEEELEAFETIEELADACLGKEVLIDVEHGQHEGNPTANILGFNPKPESAIKPIETEKAEDEDVPF